MKKLNKAQQRKILLTTTIVICLFSAILIFFVGITDIQYLGLLFCITVIFPGGLIWMIKKNELTEMEKSAHGINKSLYNLQKDFDPLLFARDMLTTEPLYFNGVHMTITLENEYDDEEIRITNPNSWYLTFDETPGKVLESKNLGELIYTKRVKAIINETDRQATTSIHINDCIQDAGIFPHLVLLEPNFANRVESRINAQEDRDWYIRRVIVISLLERDIIKRRRSLASAMLTRDKQGKDLPTYEYYQRQVNGYSEEVKNFEALLLQITQGGSVKARFAFKVQEDDVNETLRFVVSIE